MPEPRVPIARPLVQRLVADPDHGPLPALFLVLTVLSGVVDAVSILALGHVFVANMTGNLIFIGFALAGAPGFVLSASLSAFGGFVVGVLGGRALIDRVGPHRGRALVAITTVQLAMLTLALVLAAVTDAGPGNGPREGIASVMAGAMGLQNAAVRRLKVLDMVTTVVTMTLVGILAAHDEDRVGTVRRVLVLAGIFTGAVLGALLVLHVSTAAALGLAVALPALVVLAAWRGSQAPADWQRPR